MLARFSKIQYIADYLKDKREEIANWNAARGVEPASLADGRHLTNVGTFRAYVVAYLRHHPMVHQHQVVCMIIEKAPPSDRIHRSGQAFPPPVSSFR